MARQLMPKAGIMMPYVVVSRDAAIVGVSTVDGLAGTIDLTKKYLSISDANSQYPKKTDVYTKNEVNNLINPIMENALFKDDPYVNNNTPIRSGGGGGVTSVDMIKVDTSNKIVLGDYSANVQGVQIKSKGRLQILDLDGNNQERVDNVYSTAHRPETSEMPFAVIGDYIKDANGRVIGVNKTGVNSDIKQLTGLTTALSIPQGGTGGKTVDEVRSNLNVSAIESNSTYSFLYSPDRSYRLVVGNNGAFAAQTGEGNLQAFPIISGGTGATSLANARINLQVDRLIPSGDGSTFIGPPTTGFKKLGFYQSSGNWGLLNDAGNGWVPLGIPQGGTGAGNSTDASINLNYYGKFGSHFNLTNGNMDTLTGPGDKSGGETYSVAIPTDSNNVANWPLNTSGTSRAYGWGSLLCFNHGTAAGRTQIYIPDDGANLYFRQKYSSQWKNWVAVWTNKNTTVDSNGFIKKASPIVKLYDDGSSVLNDESEEVISERLSEGVYRISNCLGLNSDLSWGGLAGGIEVPKDINNQPVIWVDYEVEPDGSLLIKTYHRTHSDSPSFAQNIKEGYSNGDAIDIPKGTFISIRVSMPSNSIYNEKLKEFRLSEEDRLWEEEHKTSDQLN